MATAYKGSVYKFKKMEQAYNYLHDAGLFDLADQLAMIFEKEGYFPKLVGNKFKFKYMIK